MHFSPFTLGALALLASIAAAKPAHWSSRRACNRPDQPKAGEAPAAAPSESPVSASSGNGTSVKDTPASDDAAPPANSTTVTAGTNNTAGEQTFPPGNKRGIVQIAGSTMLDSAVTYYNNVDSVKWFGDYNQASPHVAPGPDKDFVPQMYHWDSYKDEYWGAALDQAKSKKRKYFMAMGEASTDGPWKVDGPRAAQVWKEVLQPLTEFFTLSAPVNLVGDDDWHFLDSFIENCKDCPIGFLGIHHFGPYDDDAFRRLTNFTEMCIERADRLGGIPCWVDNMQQWGTAEQQKKYLAQAIPYLENNPRVQRYAYVSPSGDDASKDLGDRFFNDDGSVTELGKWYGDYPTDGSSLAA